MSTNIHIASNTPAKSKAQEERERRELEERKKLEEQADKERKANTYEDGNDIVWVVNKETEAEYNRKKAKEKAAAKAASATKAGTNTYSKGGTTVGKNAAEAADTEKKPEKELSEKEFINKYLTEKFNQSLYYDEAQNARGNLNKAAEKKNYAAAVAKFREEAKKAFIARANGEIPDTAEATLKKSAEKAQKASSLQELRTLYANENKQAREEAARKEMLIKQQTEKRVAEAQRKAGTSALEKARLSKASGGSSAEEFRQNRSETMGKAAAGSAEGIKKIKDADLKKDIALEFQKIKYQWEEAGRRYDALSEEEKRALYRRHNSSALDRAGMTAEEGGLRSRTAQEARTALGQQIADRYYKLDEESRKLENASEYAFLNRMRSAAGAGVENLGLWLYDTFGYEPGKKVYDKGEARKIGEVTDRQVQLLVDAAPSQLGKDLVKVSDSVAQQLSYKILTAPISMFGGSVVFDKAVSKGLSAAEAAKTAGKFSGGVYTGGMALSSAADKYVQCRSEGQGKLEASVRALGTGAISYFTESLGGIGGSKSPLNGLEEKYAESIIGSILYNAFEEGGEEFLEYSADILLDGAVDLAARGEWQQEWDWAEVIENAKIGAMTGGLFGGYQKLGDIKEAVDRKIDAKKAAKLEKAVREYCDYMKNAYRLMSDPNLRKIAERQIGDTTIPAATRMNRSETGEMNFGDVLPKRAGEVSFEQMYGTKPPDGTENQSFEEWAERKDAEKKKAAEGADKSSYVNTDTTGKTEEQIKTVQDFINSVNDEIKDMAETYRNNKNAPDVRKRFSDVSERQAKDVQELTGIDISGFKNGINRNGIEHIEKRHGKAGAANSTMANLNDVARIPWVIDNYDKAERTIGQNGKPAFSTTYMNKANEQAPLVTFSKAVDGTIYVVEAVPDSKYKTLWVETAYMKKEKPSHEPDERFRSPGKTSETNILPTSQTGDVPSPNANIPQNGNSVNALDAENSVAKAQQNSENAAQTQRAETEEEARLRTLYESEPEGTETAAKTSREAPGMVSFEQMYGTKPPDGTENQSFEEWTERKDAEKKKAAEKEAILAEKQNNADSRSIRTDMTDDERYEALKNEKIKIEPYNSEKLRGENVEQLNTTTSKEVRKYIKTLAEKFEVFKKYISENARIEFRFSRNNLAESASKQGKIKAEYAEMLSATDAIVQNAVLVEAHKDKYAGTTREDKTLLQTDVLLSAFADENGIVPVRLTVKEYKDKDNSLYALITLEKIETEVSGRGESLATTPEPYPVSEMSIPDIVSKIKPTDGKILKYLPDKLLSTEQLEGKRAALAKDKGRIEEFSQKGDFAAKAQQAETEEEARLRTLYESEPTGKYSGTEAGESKAELDEKVKEAKENAVGDDELKEKPKTEKQKILKRRIEKAGLDMTVEEIVGFAQGLGRIKGFFGSERKDFARIFDDVSEGNRTIRNDLHKLLEVPHRQAQAQYTESYKNAVKAISDKFAELGIKAGSKESAAVQRIGEHAYQIDSKGNTAEYTYEMLKRDFPDSWEKIAEAAKFTRNIYDDYLKKLNAMYEKIYPNTLEKAEAYKNKVREKSVREFKKAGQLGKYARGLETNLMCGLF